MPTIHLLIKGKVQGVFFRASAKNKALELGINGWVKNTREGCVELLVNGKEDALNQFVAWCHKGPGRACVLEVEVSTAEEMKFDSFQIR